MSVPSETLTRPAVSSPGLLARVWRGLRLRDCVLISVVPVVVTVMLIGDAALRYYRAIQFDDWWSERASVAGFFHERLHATADLPARLALRQRLDPEARDPALIRLDVPRRSWDSMEADPLRLWGSWVDGTLTYGGTSIPVRLRKRGDNSIHWLTEKRTLTVRTPRDQFYKRYRGFALSVKDVIPSYLANRLAAEYGLLAPATEVVPVFLNNQYYGVFRFIEPVDESFLRPFDRMPGNIFRGDRAERGDYFKGVIRNLFDNPYLWDRVAVNDRWTSAGPGQLALLLGDLRGTTFADHERLMARLDPAELARLFAYLFLVGDPYHMDGVHNQFLYEDPSTQTLHPIPWDVRLLDLARPQDRLNDLFRAVLADPFVVDAVMREVRHQLADRGIVAVADSLLRRAERRNAPFLAYDRLREGLVPDVGDTEAALSLLHRNARLLDRWLGSDTVAFAATPTGPGLTLDLETRGLVGADLVAIGLDRTEGPVRLVEDRNLNGIPDPADPAVPARLVRDSTGIRLVPDRPIALYPGWNTEAAGVGPGRMAYRLFLRGAAGSPRPVLVNRVTGRPAALVPWPAGAPIGAPTGWHPWLYPPARPAVHRLSGTVRLSRTLIVPEGDSLVIEPGATVRLGPDVSIVSRGPVRAVGTRDRPIRIVPDEAGRPWGTFALLGSGADGSRFRQVEFVEGGGALVNRIEFTGMVNLHRTRGVVLDSVVFRRNLRSDDTFHALHSEVTLINSRFVEANSDAVDFDISTGLIANNVFEGSGGDAIDLMTSTPRIIGNHIQHAGDKGISVGEASAPFVFDNLIEDSPIGIEVKDRSAPVILSNELRHNGIGLRERLKNWRYGGSGWATVVNTLFAGSGTRLAVDSLARLTAWGVIGLDSAPAAPEPAAAPWLYARFGIGLDSVRIGRPGSWHGMAPVPPLDAQVFSDGFESIAAGWEPSGRTTRLEQRRDALVMEVEGGAGLASRAVDWRLDGPGTLVLELAGRDVAATRVVVTGADGPVTRDVATGADLDRFRLAAVPLPAGRYRRVTLEVSPRPGISHIQRSTGLSVLRGARLLLRSYAVYAGGQAPKE